MKHKWMIFFDSAGNWTLPERKIKVAGVIHDLDEYAAEHGIELPDSPKRVNSYEDLEQSQCSGSDPEHGAGDSQVTE